MSTPIEKRIGAVFIPVSNMDRAIQWYSHLLGLPVQAASHEGRIYELSMAGETRLMLDGHKPVTNSSQPLCWFWTDNIQQAHDFLRAHAVEMVTGIEDIGSLFTLTFKDPDQNLLMVCQRKETHA
jgi:predicted enzyme related to lactoylglutathione lyase